VEKKIMFMLETMVMPRKCGTIFMEKFEKWYCAAENLWLQVP
jgi:hypothetical protein